MRKNRDGYINKDGTLVKEGTKIFKKSPNELEKYIEMYNAIYEVIYELIKDNEQFKIHVTKWIMFIFEDVMEYDEEYQS